MPHLDSLVYTLLNFQAIIDVQASRQVEVVAALQTRYDKNRVVYMHYVSALDSRGTIRSNSDDLIRGKQQLEHGLKANKLINF